MEERHAPAEVSGGQVANFKAADARMSDLAPGEHGVALIARIRRGHPYVRLTLSVLLVCAGYYLGGVVGIALMFPASPIAIIWPPNAILLAALLLMPVRMWWVYLLAAIPAHLHLVTNFQPGVPLVTMLCQVFGNIIQAVIAAVAVHRFAGAPPRFDSLRSLTAFILLAAIAAPCVVAALVAYLFLLTGWVSNFWLAWRLRFLANVFATLTITPLIVLTVTSGMTTIRRAPLRRYAEFGLLTIGLFAVGISVFGLDAASPGRYPALLYTPLPFLLWAAVRFGPGGLCLSLLMVAFLSLSNAIAGRGPFVSQSPAENVLSLQIFLIAISLPLMLLTALIEERRNNEGALRRNEEALRASYEQIQSLVGRLITAQATERTRIARELHDDINQQLASLSIAFSGLKRRLPADAADVHDTLARLQQRTITLAEAIRHLSHDLHPGVLQHAGLVAALEAHCAEVGSQHAIKVTFSAAAGLEAIPQDIALCLYRVAQEALRNVARHAGATHAEVALTRWDEGIQLRVADAGRGFDLKQAGQGVDWG
jgi:signal transduction histidine kinase